MIEKKVALPSLDCYWNKATPRKLTVFEHPMETVSLAACYTPMLSPSHFIPPRHLNSFLHDLQFILLFAMPHQWLLSVVAQATYDNGCLG